jgi:anti-sigma factor RsiW
VNCSEFQGELDSYLDGALQGETERLAVAHIARCRTCDELVIDHQKARALLVTAVADRAAAVDVSGLWDEVSKRLDSVSPRVTSLAAARARRAMRSLRHAGPWGLGAASAVAAAALFAFTLVGGAHDKAATETASVASGALVQSRPVRIDSMEVGAGHTVSTWVKPRTKTRILWVASTSGGYTTVSTLTHDQ